MRNINLAFRISEDHVGRGKIETPGVKTQCFCRPWSYARHLPEDWDRVKIARRTAVAERLWENLVHTPRGGEMDLRPLFDDQRATGIVHGANPLQQMFNLISRIAERNPDYAFFGKWGGFEPWREGKRFVFYAENAGDAEYMLDRLRGAAFVMGIEIDTQRQYGLTSYQRHVKIDERLMSRVTKPEEFEALLMEVTGHPHFFHELF